MRAPLMQDRDSTVGKGQTLPVDTAVYRCHWPAPETVPAGMTVRVSQPFNKCG